MQGRGVARADREAALRQAQGTPHLRIQRAQPLIAAHYRWRHPRVRRPCIIFVLIFIIDLIFVLYLL